MADRSPPAVTAPGPNVTLSAFVPLAAEPRLPVLGETVVACAAEPANRNPNVASERSERHLARNFASNGRGVWVRYNAWRIWQLRVTRPHLAGAKCFERSVEQKQMW